MANAFASATTTKNFIAVAQFFETICTHIFKHLFVTTSKDDGLLEMVLTFFGKVETNCKGMLYFYCFVWLCKNFQLLEIRN